MLKLEELQEFEEQLKNGQIEDMFKYGAEEQRLELLELLEKAMDVGELANEVATRLLMPNIAGKGQPD